MKKLALADPSLLDDQIVMEHCDMRRGSAKANPAQPPPELHGFRKIGMCRLVLESYCQSCNLLDIITSYCHLMELANYSIRETWYQCEENEE